MVIQWVKLIREMMDVNVSAYVSKPIIIEINQQMLFSSYAHFQKKVMYFQNFGKGLCYAKGYFSSMKFMAYNHTHIMFEQYISSMNSISLAAIWPVTRMDLITITSGMWTYIL